MLFLFVVFEGDGYFYYLKLETINFFHINMLNPVRILSTLQFLPIFADINQK